MFAAATAKDFQTLMLSRFFAGRLRFVSGGAFSDLFGNETRGIAIALFSALVFIGPFISPIVGAFIAQSHLGWRWTEYITGIMGALAFALDVLLLEETYLKILLCKRAAWIRGETQNFAIHHISEEENITFKDLVEKHLLLPLRLLFLEPIVLLITHLHSIYLWHPLSLPGGLSNCLCSIPTHQPGSCYTSVHWLDHRRSSRMRDCHLLRAKI
jgi:DHA1 family multidrug resistance protein-like MFS transporter